jgi:hypothetical protein
MNNSFTNMLLKQCTVLQTSTIDNIQISDIILDNITNSLSNIFDFSKT